MFLDAGQPVRSAITVLVPPTSRSAGFAGRILERFDTQLPSLARAARRGRRRGEHAEVLLTDSELAVLRFLPSHMTNQEIAEALFLSINTVKTHLRSAYRKLGVASRREAIARGPPPRPALSPPGAAAAAAAAAPLRRGRRGGRAGAAGRPGRPARTP